VGHNRKIYNKNCGNIYEDLKLRQRIKWKINAASQIQTHQCRREAKLLLYCPPSVEQNLMPK
jgi:hypothetical protein